MTTASKRLLPALLLVSGFCGIAYEILYTKLLDAYREAPRIDPEHGLARNALSRIEGRAG